MKKRFVQIIAIALTLLFLLPALPARAEEQGEPPLILRVSVKGAIVTVLCKEPAEAYCITTRPVIPPDGHPDWRPMRGFSFSAFKSDGTYFVRVRDKNGLISRPREFTVKSGYLYVLEAEGQEHLVEPIDTFLAAHNDSIDAFNRRIAESAIAGGLYTRTGVANVSMQLMSDLANCGMTLSYQPSGNFTKEEDWGISPLWGERMKQQESDKAGRYRNYGMNCGTILIWAYKQAGLNISSATGRRGIYDSGMLRRQDDNKRKLDNGDTCDLIATKTGHTMMILDRVDTDGDGLSDSYLVLEMESPYLKLKLRSLYSVRLCTLYDMSAVFDDTGVIKANTRWYTGSFHIGLEAFPDYYGFVIDEDDEEAEEPETEWMK